MWPFTPRPQTGPKSFHVLVEWPDNKEPWLVLIKASSAREARLVIETSADVRRGRGKVISVEDAATSEA